jgi:hypothetical protein
MQANMNNPSAEAIFALFRDESPVAAQWTAH